jgi:hypothetical protein
MKYAFANRSRLVVSALFLAAFAQSVSAHTEDGEAIAKRPDATRAYKITCFNAQDGNGDPDSLEIAVRDFAPVKPPRITALIEVGTTSVEITDPRDGDLKYGPPANIKGGAGPYTVTVRKVKKNPRKPDKTLKHKEVFGFEYHCLSKTGQHTGTDIFFIR